MDLLRQILCPVIDLTDVVVIYGCSIFTCVGRAAHLLAVQNTTKDELHPHEADVREASRGQAAATAGSSGNKIHDSTTDVAAGAPVISA